VASGAYTGCISAEMLRIAAAAMSITGHSERRHGLGESDADVRAKTEAAWRAGLVAILCVGETPVSARREGTVDIVAEQLAGSVPMARTRQAGHRL